MMWPHARPRAGREKSPSAAIADSQSVKAPAAQTRGFDAGNKIVGRKRQIAVYTRGRLPMINLTTADIFNSFGAPDNVTAIHERWPKLKNLFTEGAYDRAL